MWVILDDNAVVLESSPNVIIGWPTPKTLMSSCLSTFALLVRSHIVEIFKLFRSSNLSQQACESIMYNFVRQHYFSTEWVCHTEKQIRTCTYTHHHGDNATPASCKDHMTWSKRGLYLWRCHLSKHFLLTTLSSTNNGINDATHLCMFEAHDLHL